jgi:hypothetical protein
MHATAQTTFRGVSCRRCGKPIRLSASLLKRETGLNGTEPSDNLSSKVFPARCRLCHAEAIFTLSEIADFSERDSRRI